MEIGPGKWSRPLIEATSTGATRALESFKGVGPEMAAEVMKVAQQWAAQFTVVIGTTGMVDDLERTNDVAPGSGVVIRQRGNTYGVLTAGHVLRRDGNTSNGARLTLFTTSQSRDDEALILSLSRRPCAVAGIENETDEGPDIAIIPLESREMQILDARGLTAYNLDKERWSDEDVLRLGKNPWFLSIITGVKCEASEIINSHTDEKRVALAIVTTNTRVDVVREKDGFDYLELPSETSKYSYPTNWKQTPPEAAAEEIEHLFNRGVTRQAWGGTSGAGVWNVAIGSNENGRPDGTVLVELAGICFYANPDKGCIVAHGKESITRIAVRHTEVVP